MDLKAYAGAAGKVRTTLADKVKAYRVFSVTDIRHEDAEDNWSSLTQIHAAPQWLWPALVAKMLEGQWTVATTRQMVGNQRRPGALASAPASSSRARRQPHSTVNL